MNWDIIPLCMGKLELNKSIELRLKGFSETLLAPCISWVLKSTYGVFIVDTGPSTPEHALKKHTRKLYRTQDEYLIKSLSNIKISTQDIIGIINTHLHWDHCLGNNELQDIPIYIQKEEIHYSSMPLPCDAGSYESYSGHSIIENFYDRIIHVDGDIEISSGITLISTPGHTPGSQSVVVNTQEGIKIIAGDLIGLYEALQSYPPHLPGIYHNIEDCYKSFEKIYSITSNILPSHDMNVFK